MRFVDMCSVQKISLVLLADKYHGYYLHCDAAYEVRSAAVVMTSLLLSFDGLFRHEQFADGPIEDLVKHLSDEAGNMRVGRCVCSCSFTLNSASMFDLRVFSCDSQWPEGIARCRLSGV